MRSVPITFITIVDTFANKISPFLAIQVPSKVKKKRHAQGVPLSIWMGLPDLELEHNIHRER
jgi:hypothetical protein